MLLSPFSTPRRLVLFVLVCFVIALLTLQSSPYRREYLPDSSSLSSFSQGTSTSLEEDDYKAPAEGWGSQGEDSVSEGEKPEAPKLPVEPPMPTDGSAAQDSSDKSKPALNNAGAEEYWAWKSETTTPYTAGTTTTDLSNPTKAPTATKDPVVPLVHEHPEVLASKVQSLIADFTPPPLRAQWPPFEWYPPETDRDYHPSLWEGFEWDSNFYVGNGIKSVKAQMSEAEPTPTPYMPYPDYNSAEYKKKWKGEYVPCEGARGKIVAENDDDLVKAWPQTPKNFPRPANGNVNVTGIDIEHCFDRYNRYGPYGLGQTKRDKVEDWKKPAKVNWSRVPWGDLVDKCLMANKDRFAPIARQPVDLKSKKEMPKDANEMPERDPSQSSAPHHHPRTALLIRTWEGYDYKDNDIEAIRALITELSLLSGGEYQVFLFVNVKDPDINIFTDEKIYNAILRRNVPKELRSITVLWNEQIFANWYPEVMNWEVYWHQFMPLQWFMKTHPEFDYVWNWETDARYTGNHYHFFEQVSQYAKNMPRKYLWERNSRFYFEDAHGTYEQFLNDTDTIVEEAARNGEIQPVWGPNPYNATLQKPIGPKPPTSMEQDNYEWGVGEEADFITLQPLWDPIQSGWSYRNKIWNFLPHIRPHFTNDDGPDDQYDHPEFVNIPRRVFINTVSRFSRRQLHAMHLENLAGRTMQAEMWPGTVSLHHGLKAVYTPHPIWTDRIWPGWYMDYVFNADGGERARWGTRYDSPYNWDREHNFGGWSWYYQTSFPSTLYRRFLGWKASAGNAIRNANNPLRVLGGESFEEQESHVDMGGENENAGHGRQLPVGGLGRMCLPGMLLHPVKGVYEDAPQEDA